MNLMVVVIVGVVAIVAVSAVSSRIGVAAPLALVVVGFAMSFMPSAPEINIAPELMLAGVLPPLLYSAAVNMPGTDFRRNFKAISGLAVILVLVTTAVTAVVIHAIRPDIGWPAAFALGAVVSPTDAVAATSVGRRVGLPPRLMVMLEGEGLMNDASALVLLRAAVAAMAGSVSLWSVAGSFAYSVVVAVVVGVAVGVIAMKVRMRLHDPVLTTTISFVVPFLAYLPAEELGASGVISVVAAGLAAGGMREHFLPARDRLAEAINWRTVAFIMESATFLLMGYILKPVFSEAAKSGAGAERALLAGAVITVLLIGIRMAFMVPLVGMIKADYRRVDRDRDRLDQHRQRADAIPSTRKRRRIDLRLAQIQADLEFREREVLGWRSGVILGWAGMRGAVTLAAVQTLPEDTPHRAGLVLTACVVAIATLLLHGLTLPWVIRAMKVESDDEERLLRDKEQLAQEIREGAQQRLDAMVRKELADGDGVMTDIDSVVVAEIRDHLNSETEVDDGTDPREYQDRFNQIRMDVLRAERAALLEARRRGSYSSEALTWARQNLDFAELRLGGRG